MQAAGIILAAGRSERMGRPKALLTVGGRSFVATVVAVARGGGLRPVRVVVPASLGLTAVHPELAELLVINPDQHLGQLHSLRLALAAIEPGADAAVVFLVDHPLVRVETVRALVDARRHSGRAIVIPTYRGRRGHPVLFAREVFGELREGPLAGGARRVVRADAGRVLEVEVDDPGVRADIDTPEEYATMVGDERTG